MPREDSVNEFAILSLLLFFLKFVYIGVKNEKN